MISVDVGAVNGVILVLEIGGAGPPAPPEGGGGEDLEEEFKAAGVPRKMDGSGPDGP